MKSKYPPSGNDVELYKLRGVIFDFDGTLADSREDVWASIDAAARAVSRWVPAEFRSSPQNLALSHREIFDALYPRGGEDTFIRFEQVLHDHYLYQNTFEHTVLYPGIEELLERLMEEEWGLYIVSTKQFTALDKLLKIKKWDRYFKKWLCPDGPAEGLKTKRELIQCILDEELRDVPVVYVGDSWGDIRAAHENNIPAVGILYGDGDPELLLREKPEYCAGDAVTLGRLLFSNNFYRSGHTEQPGKKG
jgi:phosphoglycolate phosphatase